MCYVYSFRNSNKEIIYIGRTENLDNRLSNQHFTERGHLSKECYQECEYIEYIELDSKNEMRIYEIFYISKFKPKYNEVYKEEDNLLFSLPEKEWVYYTKKKSIDEEVLIKEDLIKELEFTKRTLSDMEKKLDKVGSNIILTLEGIVISKDAHKIHDGLVGLLESLKDEMCSMMKYKEYKLNKRGNKLIKIKGRTS